MTLILFGLALVVLIAAVLLVVTAIGSARMEARFPPVGTLVPVQGGRLHVLDRGPRTSFAVVLIHGASGNLRDLDASLGQALAAEFRVVAVDRPGHGYSSRPDTAEAATPEAQARAVSEALVTLGVERALVVGHSLGAAIAAALALEDPERTAGLALITPATHPWGGGGISWHNHVAARGLWGRVFSWLLPFPVGLLVMHRAVTEVFRPDIGPDQYPDRIGAGLVLRPDNFRANAQDVVDLLENVTRLSPRYTAIKAPSVIIDGRHDPIVWNHIHADGLMRDLEQARRVTLDTGHMPHWTATDAIIAEIAAEARALSRARDPALPR